MQSFSEKNLPLWEEMSKTTNHIPGLYQVGETWLQPDWNFFSRTLTRELVQLGALQAFLWKDQFLYEFGFKILSPIKIDEKFRINQRKILKEYIPKKMVSTGSLEKEGRSLETFTSTHSKDHAEFILVLVKDKSTTWNSSAWDRIVELLESFGYAYGGKDRRFIPTFSQFSNHFLQEIRKRLDLPDKYGVVTQFYIQNLDKYFQAMGLQKSLEILKNIQSVLMSFIKTEDIFVHLDSRSYFVFSPQCKKDVVLKRYEQVFLQVHHLIVDYRMRFWEVDSYTDLEKGWSNFLFDIDKN